jgi:hypothetical protein
MTDFVPSESGTPIRYPSTANLMIDSMDSVRAGFTTNPFNFQITKNQSILNGFFTRVGTTEVVLNWVEPNIVTGYNDTFTVTKTSGPTSYTVTVPEGIYTVAQLLDTLVTLLNAAGTGITWSITGVAGNCGLAGTAAFSIPVTTLSTQLNISDSTSGTKSLISPSPDLRPHAFIDFISSQLTYNQAVKDSATSTREPQVLCRWYFAWDEQPLIYAYGFPILMGYTPFVARRTFNPPKQIRWSPNQPIGNLAFQVLGENGDILANEGLLSSWQMTLQVSEV